MQMGTLNAAVEAENWRLSTQSVAILARCAAVRRAGFVSDS